MRQTPKTEQVHVFDKQIKDSMQQSVLQKFNLSLLGKLPEVNNADLEKYKVAAADVMSRNSHRPMFTIKTSRSLA